MTGLWMLTAVVCAAEAIWLKQWRPVRAPSDLAPAERMRELPLPLILEMLSVAIRQGSSIPRALIAVGDIAAGEFGVGLRSAGEQLNEGVSWDDAWPDDGDLSVVRDAFASSWHSGASPVERLETAVEQLDWDERADRTGCGEIVGSFVATDRIVFSSRICCGWDHSIRHVVCAMTACA